ncbi:MAG: hypothetical protein AB7I36_08870 [Rhodospirillaceae bacterium]
MAKQTGPLQAVKGNRRLLGRAILFAAGLGALAVIAGCASGWTHPRKQGAEAAADERECSQRAEENVLARIGRQRSTYGSSMDPNPGMSRGETPMQMLDRTQTQDDYGRDFENCMTSKGYSKK